jgi:sorbitol-specific phosphotransferase system component IIC
MDMRRLGDRFIIANSVLVQYHSVFSSWAKVIHITRGVEIMESCKPHQEECIQTLHSGRASVPQSRGQEMWLGIAVRIKSLILHLENALLYVYVQLKLEVFKLGGTLSKVLLYARK